MADNFQNIINNALQGIEVHFAEASTHFQPISEDTQQAQIIKQLQKRRKEELEPGRVHVGVAGAFNFSIVVQTHPDKILLLDMNNNQALCWEKIIGLFKRYESPKQFLEGFMQIQSDLLLRDFEGLDSRKYLQSIDWMQPNAYTYLHRLALKGNIATATLDIANDNAAALAIGKALKEQQLIVDTCYWSNIAIWFKPVPKGTVLNHDTSTSDNIFKTNSGGLIYNNNAFYELPTSNRYMTEYDGSERIDTDKHAVKIPLFENMLRNISAIGSDPCCMHMLCDVYNCEPPIITEGPPRNLRRMAERQEMLKQNVQFSREKK